MHWKWVHSHELTIEWISFEKPVNIIWIFFSTWLMMVVHYSSYSWINTVLNMLVVSQWANVGLFQLLHNRITEEVTFINSSLTYKLSLTKCPWYVCSVVSVLVSLLVLITNIVLLDAKKNSCISESYFFLLSAYRKKNYSKKKAWYPFT